MSALKAEVVRVEVSPHPNADRLDLCKVKGWQCVAQKGQYKSGDLAVYIPIDSVLPQALVAALGIEKMYHKRIRTVKLRGYVSQGMLMPFSMIGEEDWVAGFGFEEGDDVTSILGITKYEETVPVHMAGKALPEPAGMLKYTDIENIKNHPGLFAPDEAVVAREKIHGTNFRAARIRGELYVGSHRLVLARDESNLYWRGAAILELDHKLAEGEQVFGEIYGSGIQDLAYGCKPGEIQVAVFDLFKDGQFVSDSSLVRACSERFWRTAPYVYSGPFSGLSMPKESAILPGHLIEGLVIRPLMAEWSERLQGRKVLKSLSDEYLLRKDGTERH